MYGKLPSGGRGPLQVLGGVGVINILPSFLYIYFYSKTCIWLHKKSDTGFPLSLLYIHNLKYIFYLLTASKIWVVTPTLLGRLALVLIKVPSESIK